MSGWRESRAKIVYEYLLKFTEDKMVQESLRFLMTREITHFQQFTAGLNNIEPNFPPGQLQEVFYCCFFCHIRLIFSNYNFKSYGFYAHALI